MPHLLKANFSQAPKKCSANFAFISKDLPLCGWGGRPNSTFRAGVGKIMLDSYIKFRDDIGHKRPCQVTEYSGEPTYKYKYADKGNNMKMFVIRFKFKAPGLTTHYTEHLVFDLVGMIGSVGGTLGMCVGFSFSGITTMCDL